MLTEKYIERIAGLFANRIASIKDLNGFHNYIYEVSGDTDFILRISRKQNEAATRSEIDFLLYLYKNGARLLEAHLNSYWDAASRRHEFLDKSVNWIASIAPPSQYKHLLDLGCGPGLYAERFNRAGYSVMGVDFSKRSIAYAREQALLNKSNIEYHYQNYLTIDYKEQFDVITLIYCDYAVL